MATPNSGTEHPDFWFGEVTQQAMIEKAILCHTNKAAFSEKSERYWVAERVRNGRNFGCQTFAMVCKKTGDVRAAVTSRIQNSVGNMDVGLGYNTFMGINSSNSNASVNEANVNAAGAIRLVQEAGNAPFCPSQEKFRTVVFHGLGNVSGTL